MRFKARVRRATGNTQHVIHGAESIDIKSQIASVEIEPSDGGFLLLYVSRRGECLADTWHESLERAKAQARFELEIEEPDWEDVDAG